MKKLLAGMLAAFLIFSPVGVCPVAHATVSTTTDKVIYTGDGVSSAFSFSFPVYVQTDIQVSINQISTGTLTALTLTTNYTVALTKIGYGKTYNGTVTLLAPYTALSNDYQIIIKRTIPLTQLISLQDNSVTPAATYMEGYDRATMLSQQMQEQIDRSVKLPVSTVNSPAFPSASPGQIIGWKNDSSGDLTNFPSATGPVGPKGDSGTMAVGTVTKGITASITNVGTPDTAILNFVLPQGDTGPQGLVGATGPAGPAGSGAGDVLGPASNPDAYVPYWAGASTKTLANGYAVGTGANNLVKITASSKIPAVDGSLLTGITTSQIGGTVPNSGLDQIVTASKVSGTAVSSLNLTPAAAGRLPRANCPLINTDTTVALADADGEVIDASKGNVFTMTATADHYLGTPINPTDGQKIVIIFYASAAGRTLSLPVATTGDFLYGTTITGLTQTAVGTADVIGCIYSAAAQRWRVVAVSKGYSS